MAPSQRLILASGSLGRRELLKLHGYAFEVQPADVDEPTGEGTKPMGQAMSKDGSRLYVTTGRGKKVVVIEPPAEKVIASFEAGDRPWGIALSPDEKTVAAAGTDRVVRLWDAHTGQERLQLNGHTGPLYSLAFRADGPGTNDTATSSLNAHTNPVYLEANGVAPRSAAQARSFLKWIDQFEVVLRSRNRFPTARLRNQAQEQLEAARLVYARIIRDAK